MVFIDRHLPRTFSWKSRNVRVEPFLLTHEIIEELFSMNCSCTMCMPIRSRSVPSALRSKPRVFPGAPMTDL
jgi:hypothetical protein